MKLVIAVRRDVDMGRGKVAAQVGHACVEAALGAAKHRPDTLRSWMDRGQPKVVVRVDSLDELEKLRAHAASVGVPTFVIRDAGHTQLEPGTVTCMGLGPGPDETLDRITGHLKLL